MQLLKRAYYLKKLVDHFPCLSRESDLPILRIAFFILFFLLYDKISVGLGSKMTIFSGRDFKVTRLRRKSRLSTQAQSGRARQLISADFLSPLYQFAKERRSVRNQSRTQHATVVRCLSLINQNKKQFSTVFIVPRNGANFMYLLQQDHWSQPLATQHAEDKLHNLDF